MGELLAGRAAVITGAGTGIGRAIASRFAAEGSAVMLLGRRLGPLEETAAQVVEAGGSAWVRTCDVSDGRQCLEATAAALAAMGGFDILVNNAAIDEEVGFLDITEESWDRVLDTNLKGCFLMSQAACRLMAAGRGGALVHLSSVDRFGANGLYTTYNVSKSGLMGLNRCIAVEMARHGIRSNAVSPGATRTEMVERVVGADAMDHLMGNFGRVPMRRMVYPEEVASACAFLASEGASAITGTELVVDCGTIADLYLFDSLPAEAVASGA
jgi:NAD(P)-dependent dehydrogenase (short-subunit alcohol dehydrogenase family)